MQQKKNYKPFIEPKEGAIASTSLINELQLKIGAKLMIIHNIDTSDCLTNGQLGILVDVIKSKAGDVDKLVLQLNNKHAGKDSRRKHHGLASKYPECVMIEPVSIQYTLRKRGGDVSSTATAIQFPVKLAYAITSHKIQGQTIPAPTKVVLDIDTIFEDAQAHVMLSRVQQLSQVYILNKFEESKIRTSKIGLEETERLSSISLNINPSFWKKQMKKAVKIITLNCAGLKEHFKDIETDDTLQMGNIINLIETSLETNEEELFTLEGYKVHHITIGKGKGISTYYKANIFKHEDDFIKTDMQISKFSTENLDILAVYRTSKGNSVELLNKLVELISHGNPTVITGDFNICFQVNGNNRMSQGLIKKENFSQLMNEPTHILGRHIDHAYWRDPMNMWMDPVLERYSPYYSDHDASCITLVKQV